jgi:hypothetical protein
VIFHKSDSHVLDSSGKRVFGISRIGNVFQADFSSAQSSLRCLISQSSSELWKWHRRLGHLSFDLLCRLSGLGLLRGLPLLKFESDLVCAPCRLGKMIAAFHSPVNTVMTEQLGQLLHPGQFILFSFYLCFIWRIVFACLVVCRCQVRHGMQR